MGMNCQWQFMESLLGRTSDLFLKKQILPSEQRWSNPVKINEILFLIDREQATFNPPTKITD
jgi:hypothetical protein